MCVDVDVVGLLFVCVRACVYASSRVYVGGCGCGCVWMSCVCVCVCVVYACACVCGRVCARARLCVYVRARVVTFKVRGKASNQRELGHFFLEWIVWKEVI